MPAARARRHRRVCRVAEQQDRAVAPARAPIRRCAAFSTRTPPAACTTSATRSTTSSPPATASAPPAPECSATASRGSARTTSRCCSCIPKDFCGTLIELEAGVSRLCARSARMGWVTGIVVYVLVWWVTLFAILPLWVTPVRAGRCRVTPPARRNSRVCSAEAGADDSRGGGDLARHLLRRARALVQLPRFVSPGAVRAPAASSRGMSAAYCLAAPGHPVHGPYHDTEYGFPSDDEAVLFERLVPRDQPGRAVVADGVAKARRRFAPPSPVSRSTGWPRSATPMSTACSAMPASCATGRRSPR